MDLYTEKLIMDTLKIQDIKTIIAMLNSRKLDPNYRFTDSGVAPMHLAVGYGTEGMGAQIVYHLLRYGGDPNLSSTDGVTPVHVASSWSRTTILHLLLLYGGDPWIQDEEMKNAFNYAEEAKAWPALELLHNFQLNRATSKHSKRLEMSPAKTINILPERDLKSLNASGMFEGLKIEAAGNLGKQDSPVCSDNSSIIQHWCDSNKSSSSTNVNFEFNALSTGLAKMEVKDEVETRVINVGGTSIKDPLKDEGDTSMDRLTYVIDKQDLADIEEESASSDTANSTYPIIIHINDNFDKESNRYTSQGKENYLKNLSMESENNKSIDNISNCVVEDLVVSSKFYEDVTPNTTENESFVSSFGEFNVLNTALIGIEISSDSSKEISYPFKNSIEIIMKDNALVAEKEESRKTYTVKEGKTDLLISGEKPTTTTAIIARNMCVERVKLFEDKSKNVSIEKTAENRMVDDLNKTFTLKQSPDARADLFAELSAAVRKRSLRMTNGGQDTCSATSSIGAGVAITGRDGGHYSTRDGNKQVTGFEVEKENKTIEQVTIDVANKCDEKKTCVIASGETSPSTSSEEELYVSCLGDSSVERQEHPLEMDSDDALRQKLLACGKEVGPITNTTRAVYQRMLADIQRTGAHSTPQPQTHQSEVEQLKITSPPLSYVRADVTHTYTCNFQYCPELSAALQNPNGPLPYENLELNMQKDFSESSHDWRGGSAKTCFNYLLLDERVTKNLPARSTTLTGQEVTRIFIDAIFYVGKGQAGRPYAHLQSALTIWKTKSVPSDPKTAHILSIWKEKYGVVCLHVFHNTITAEAHTREAAMIDGLSRTNIRNLRRGEYYGRAARWTLADQRKLGVRLLLKAKDILLSEGERAIRPEDIMQYPAKRLNDHKRDAFHLQSKKHTHLQALV